MLLSLDIALDRLLLSAGLFGFLCEKDTDHDFALRLAWLNLPPILIPLPRSRRVFCLGGTGKSLLFELADSGYKVLLRKTGGHDETSESDEESSSFDVELKYPTDFDLSLALVALPRKTRNAATSKDEVEATDSEQQPARTSPADVRAGVEIAPPPVKTKTTTAHLVAFSTLHCAELVRYAALAYIQERLADLYSGAAGGEDRAGGVGGETKGSSSSSDDFPFQPHAMNLRNPKLPDEPVALSFHLRVAPFFAEPEAVQEVQVGEQTATSGVTKTEAWGSSVANNKVSRGGTAEAVEAVADAQEDAVAAGGPAGAANSFGLTDRSQTRSELLLLAEKAGDHHAMDDEGSPPGASAARQQLSDIEPRLTSTALSLETRAEKARHQNKTMVESITQAAQRRDDIFLPGTVHFGR